MSVIVYHGTTAERRASIEVEGLTPQDEIAPFVAVSRDRAIRYAMRAVCFALCERGMSDERHDVPRMLVVELAVDPDRLTPDNGSVGEFSVPAGIPPEWIVRTREFDSRPHLPPPHEVREQAEFAALSRRLERRRREWMHSDGAHRRAPMRLRHLARSASATPGTLDPTRLAGTGRKLAGLPAGPRPSWLRRP